MSEGNPARHLVNPGTSHLVDLALAGDQEAFAELYLDSLPRIRAVGWELLRGPGSESDVEDFCSDVYLLALKYLGSFRGECKFSTWIVRIARHKALAMLQRRAQQKNGDNQLVSQGCETSDEQWESECSVAEDRRLSAATAANDIDRLMETLSPEYRELVQLRLEECRAI